MFCGASTGPSTKGQSKCAQIMQTLRVKDDPRCALVTEQAPQDCTRRLVSLLRSSEVQGFCGRGLRSCRTHATQKRQIPVVLAAHVAQTPAGLGNAFTLHGPFEQMYDGDLATVEGALTAWREPERARTQRTRLESAQTIPYLRHTHFVILGSSARLIRRASRLVATGLVTRTDQDWSAVTTLHSDSLCVQGHDCPDGSVSVCFLYRVRAVPVPHFRPSDVRSWGRTLGTSQSPFDEPNGHIHVLITFLLVQDAVARKLACPETRTPIGSNPISR